MWLRIGGQALWTSLKSSYNEDDLLIVVALIALRHSVVVVGNGLDSMGSQFCPPGECPTFADYIQKIKVQIG